MNVKEEINLLSEEEYQKFTARLLPGVANIKGVRLLNLRKIAKKIAREDWKKFILDSDDASFEEILLQGLVIGYVKVDQIEDLFPWITKYVKKVNNWSSCDSFCTGLKITHTYEKTMWKYLQTFFCSKEEFEIRFAVVMGINYYINDQYKDMFLRILNQIHHEGYYVKMAVAWAISMIYVKYPEETLTFLYNNELDDFTFNKTIQKILESYQVNSEEKEMLRGMKRKGKKYTICKTYPYPGR